MNAIEKIHGYLKFGMVLGLERMEALLGKLGDPQNEVPFIHVAGTNGKGSIARYTYEILRQGGYHVGLYTSPYLEVFNERIEMDGEYISDEDLEGITDRVIAAADEMVAEGMESPTEFEIVTAIAFVYFYEKGCDMAVLEVGLGGRGDSTNVITDPLCSIISSISLDHTDRLGSTIAQIAGEKAGIIKKGCPVVCAAGDEEAKAVLRKRAADLQAPFFDVTRVEPLRIREDLSGQAFDAEIMGRLYRGVEISMAGRFQIQNAIAALSAVEILRQQGRLDMETKDVKVGIKKAVQIGRFEVLSGNNAGETPVIIDGAHNRDGSRALAEAVEKLLPKATGKPMEDIRILLTCGILKDKEVGAILDNFGRFATEFIATEPDNDRKLAAEELADKIKEMGYKCEPAADPEMAVARALSRREEFDALIFAGSLYLIGKIRRTILNGLQ